MATCGHRLFGRANTLYGLVVMVKLADCSMCQDPLFNDRGNDHPEKIADLGVCTAVLNRDWQGYEGTTVLVFQEHATELHQLTPDVQHMFMDDAARIAKALEKTYPDTKLNHALLGNATRHLHLHVIVRRSTHTDPRSTIWETPFPNPQQTDENLRKTAEEIRRNL